MIKVMNHSVKSGCGIKCILRLFLSFPRFPPTSIAEVSVLEPISLGAYTSILLKQMLENGILGLKENIINFN